MRIQHNIMAMNAYRNYNANNKALSGNLEKLSSGYKINRAGDDAAGLAISEKMRAQITGLNAAQKNVKDGISLVKTAEGAMQEIQDMLNRMDYLATQSANGTYQDDVDREALQKEVDQLKSEINRIADSANFNGIKLLDGSKDGSGSGLANAQAAAKTAADEVAAAKKALAEANAKQVAGKDTAMEASAIKELFAAPTSTSAASVGSATILETDAADTGDVGFRIDLDGVEYTLSGVGTNAVTINIGKGSISITEAQITTNLGLTGTAAATGTVISGEQLATAIAKQYLSANATGGTLIKGEGSSDTSKYKITADGTKLNFAATNNLDSKPNRHYDVSIAGTQGTKVDATTSTYTSSAVSLSGTLAGSVGANTTITMTVAYKYVDDTGAVTTGSKAVSIKTGAGTTSAANVTKALADAINKDDDLKKYFTATVASGATTITLTSQKGGAVGDAGDKAAVKGASTATSITMTASDNKVKLDAATSAATSTAGADAYTPGFGNSYVNPGTEAIVMAGEDKKDLLASTTLDLSDVLKDGTVIKLGDEEYRIALGENSAYAGEVNDKGVREYEGAKVVYLADKTAAVSVIASKLSEVAKDNETFTVSHAGTSGTIGLKQKADVKDSTDMTTMDNFVEYVGVSVISKAGDQTAKQNAIKEATANLEAAVKKQEAADARVEELKKSPGKAIQLQIGDTSDDFNQLQVNIGDMHADALGIGNLSISTAEDAAAAIETIKNAINQVSSVRGDLGAYQNRLDHTANNLSVMAENIQDAESTIRDTDVAEEMMSYVKNNILVQSAQAMLAQANQVPQGVLQLLG